jgi:hypothetical protein
MLSDGAPHENSIAQWPRNKTYMSSTSSEESENPFVSNIASKYRPIILNKVLQFPKLRLAAVFYSPARRPDAESTSV